MNRLMAVSVAIVGFGFAPDASRLASAGHFVPRMHAPTSHIAPPETRSFIYSGDRDGSGGETVTRNGDVISGDMWMGTKHAHYEGRIAADGTIPRLDIRAWRSATEAKNPRVVSAIIGRDSVNLIEHLGSRVDTLRFASRPGMVPVINPSMGLAELAIARARSQKSRSAKVPILLIDALSLDTPGKAEVGAAPSAIDVTFLAADSVMIGNGTSTDQMRIIIETDGHIRSAASGSTAKDKFSIRSAAKPLPPSK